MLTERLEETEKRFMELSELITLPEVISAQERFQKYSKERAHLEKVVEAWRELKRLDSEIRENKLIIEGKDEDLRSLAKEELPILERQRDEVMTRIKVMLLPTGPCDEKNILIEIRAGT